MHPVIAIVGRPNVGKSTLFNCLTRSRDALVADLPGVTRDRLYGDGRLGERPYIVVDTGGITDGRDQIDELTLAQVRQAAAESDAVVFVTDGRAGVTPADADIAAWLRRLGKTIHVVVNKVDGLDESVILGDFHALGLGDPWPVAAVHGRGVTALITHVLSGFPEQPRPDAGEAAEEGILIAVAGRPNVGKSTLVNRILGEERVVVSDQAGTTRDSIRIPLQRNGRRYTLIDTAGVRRRGRVQEAVEKFSVVKTLQAIESGHVTILLLDARAGVSDQDLKLLGFVLDTGKAIVVAVNKWDGMDEQERGRLRRELDRRLVFLDFARVHFISALHGSGVGGLFASVGEAYDAATRKLPTHRLTRVLEDAVASHPPPLVQGRRIKLRYAHMGGQNPPVIVVHGNQTERVPTAYRRYLANVFRQVFKLRGTPLRVEFKSSDNPFAGRKNKLTPRQVRKRKRLLRHVRG